MNTSINLDALLCAITPEIFAQRFSVPGSLRTENGSTICCFPNMGEVRIHAGGFVPTLHAAYRGASILDACVMIQKLNGALSYYKAVSTVVKSFRDRLAEDYQSDDIIDKIGTEAKKYRRIFNQLACRPSTISSIPGDLAIKLTPGLKNAVGNNNAVFLTSLEVATLCENIYEAYGIIIDCPDTNMIVIPYFSNAYEVSAIDMISSVKVYPTVFLTDYKHSFTNVHQIQEKDTLFMEADTQHAFNSMQTANEENTAIFSMVLNPNGETKSIWLPSSFYYVDRFKDMNIVFPGSLVDAGCKCNIVSHPSLLAMATTGVLPWDKCVTTVIIDQLLETERIDVQSRMLIDTVRANADAKYAIKEALNEHQLYWLSSQIDSVMRDGLVVTSSQGNIFSTAGGYVLETKDGDVSLSNFIIQPLHSIRYEVGEIYYCCRIRLGRKYHTVILNNSGFETVNKLINSIQTSLTFSGALGDESPMIFDSSKFKLVIPTLHKQFSKLEVRIGSSHLGWNGTRTKFICPDVEFATVAKDLKVELRTDRAYLEHFSNELVTGTLDTVTTVHKDLLGVIHSCVGIVLRTYANYIVRPVCYKNTETARKLLLLMFKHMGQRSIVMLNQNMRNEGALESLQGYTFIATGYNKHQALASKSSMILLTEVGTSINKASFEEADKAGMCLRYIVKEAVAYLIENGGAPFELEKDFTQDILNKEGKAFTEFLLNNKLIENTGGI